MGQQTKRKLFQSATSVIRGVINSLCLIPSENLGGLGLFIDTFSGLCAPGPGFSVGSANKKDHHVLNNCKLQSKFKNRAKI